MLTARAAVLEDQVSALKNAIDGMHMQEEVLGDVLAGIARIPSACGLWQGARAQEFFSQCTEGSLYGTYRGALDAAASAIRKLEAALRDLQGRLEEVHASTVEADENYAYWAQKAAYYW